MNIPNIYSSSKTMLDPDLDIVVKNLNKIWYAVYALFFLYLFKMSISLFGLFNVNKNMFLALYWIEIMTIFDFFQCVYFSIFLIYLNRKLNSINEFYQKLILYQEMNSITFNDRYGTKIIINFIFYESNCLNTIKLLLST